MTAGGDLTLLFGRRLLVVSGKGGVGKTTVAAAFASRAAASGRTVLLMSTDGRGDAAAYFGKDDPGYRETELAPSLFGLTSDFDALLKDFVDTAVPVRLVGQRLLASATFRYFTRATPGLPDLLVLGKIRELIKRSRPKRGEPKYDLVILDAPAAGHALSMLGIPRTLLKTVPAGPMRKLAVDLDGLLSDPARSSLVVVAEPAELAAREAEELAEGAKANAGLTTELVVVNRIGRSGRPETLPRLALDIPVIRVPEIEEEEGTKNASKEGNGEPRAGKGPSRTPALAATPDQRFFEKYKEALAGDAPEPRPARRGGARPAHLPFEETPGRSPGSPLSEADRSFSLLPWLGDSKLLVLTGPGGVGKTTLSAAAGIAAARAGRRVLVLTVDPARRLAQALGLRELEGRRDRPAPVRVAGLPSGAALTVMQIDPKATFERLLSRVAPPGAVDRIRANRLYSGLVDSLPGVLEYMGVEALWEHAQDPGIDLIVLDTPPAARGLDFLSAPGRMVALLENDALRWFLRSDSLLGRALSGASRGAAAILRLADNALGFGFLADLADFFRVFDGLYEGFAARSREISALLGEGRFLVVTSLDRSALRTAAETAAGLLTRGASPALIVNRVAASARQPALPDVLAKLPRTALTESDASAAALPSFLSEALSR